MVLTECWSPLLLLRCFPPPVCAADAGCGHPLVLSGAGSRSGHPTGEHRSVEVHLPQAGRDRLLQLCGKIVKIPGVIFLLNISASINKFLFARKSFHN